MEYKQTLDYLFGRLPMYQRVGPAAYKANLNNTIRLSEYLHHPENNFKSIHVAGTNGKGSIAHMLASVFQAAGYKTGLATSPHLKDFRERIKVNGTMMPESEVSHFVQAHKAFFEQLEPSFFEMTMAMTFDYFAKQNVDIAIIETGLGGRLDSSNIITPELSVITNIGMDHTALLGKSLEKIAGEKAGIIKRNVPVVIGRKQAEIHHVFERFAADNRAELFVANSLFSIADRQTKHNDGKLLTAYRIQHNNNEMAYDLDLHGFYQGENLLTVLGAMHVLKCNASFVIPEDAIRSGLQNVVNNTDIRGRWQQLGVNPLIICDAGHNADGVSYIVSQLKQLKRNNLHMVIGMVDDKDRGEVLNLLPVDASYYFCRPGVPRGLDENILSKEAVNYGLAGNPYASVKDALAQAKQNALPNDVIFVGGSTFVAAEVV